MRNKFLIEDITKELQRSPYLWISPAGKVYGNGSHVEVARSIYYDIFGLPKLESYDVSFGDKLLKLGWIKLSATAMAYIYEKDGMYDHLTEEQLAVCKDLDDLYPGEWFFSTSFLYK